MVEFGFSYLSLIRRSVFPSKKWNNILGLPSTAQRVANELQREAKDLQNQEVATRSSHDICFRLGKAAINFTILTRDSRRPKAHWKRRLGVEFL